MRPPGWAADRLWRFWLLEKGDVRMMVRHHRVTGRLDMQVTVPDDHWLIERLTSDEAERLIAAGAKGVAEIRWEASMLRQGHTS